MMEWAGTEQSLDAGTAMENAGVAIEFMQLQTGNRE
jgi:hypothetical protein